MVNDIVKFEVSDGWENLTTTAKFTIPKQIVATDFDTDQPLPIIGSNINIGGSSNPLFLKGDQIQIYAGYWYNDDLGTQQQYVRLIFSGYLTKIKSKLQIDFECEDFMWILKQIPVPNKAWGNISIQDIISQQIAGNAIATAAGITIATQSKSTFTFDNGTFTTHNESVAQVLARLKKDIGMVSYFRDNELRILYPVYYAADVTTIGGLEAPYQFIFQQNIISDNLLYQRKDDVVLSAVATNMISVDTDVITKDGNTQTRKTQMKVFVWCDQPSQAIKSRVITDDSQIPVSTEGQRFDFKFADCVNITELTNRAVEQLNRAYYTGFKGDFTTFLMPYIRFGDNVAIQDNVLPDRNGVYKVKKVEYSGGYAIGGRQRIFIDYLIQ